VIWITSHGIFSPAQERARKIPANQRATNVWKKKRGPGVARPIPTRSARQPATTAAAVPMSAAMNSYCGKRSR
jgi:hypothetical protein